MRGCHLQRWKSRGGFSLTETILLIAIIGILGATAAPRFLDVSETDARIFHRETLSALRYARKLAVASHCPVQFDFTAGGFGVLQRASCSSGTYTQGVFDPATGVASYTGTGPDGISITSTLDPLYFDPLGRVVDSAGAATDVTISVGGVAIAALGETGFIYVP